MAVHTRTGATGSPSNFWFTRDVTSILSATAGVIILNNNDNTTQTRLFSAANNFTFTNVGGVITLTGGTITSMSRTDISGATTFETVTGISYAATSFQARIADASLQGVASAIFNGVDTFTGSSLNDSFRTYGGNDVVNGGAGFDTVAYAHTSMIGPITVTLGTSNVPGAAQTAAGSVTAASASIGTDTLSSVEEIIGTSLGDTFTAFRNFLPSAGFSANQFEGLGGNDVINGNGSTRLSFANSFSAGPGATVTWTNAAANTNGAGTATGAGIGTDTFTGVDSVRGSDFVDTLTATGASLAQFTLDAGFTFEGRGGNDLITGGGTNRRWDSNTARYDNDTGSITVTLGTSNVVGAATTSTGSVTGAASGTDTLSFVEGIRGSGNADVFTAFKNFRGLFDDFNQFQGMAGNDTITGNGATRISYGLSTAPVTVTWTPAVSNVFIGSGTAVGNSSVGTDTFTGVNSVRGSEFADTFTATSAHGFLTFVGGAGNDRINGGTRAINNLDFDTVAYTGSSAGVSFSLNLTSTVTGNATVGTDTMVSVERFRGSHFDDTYVVNAGFVSSYAKLNVFDGGGGNDSITGNGSTRVDYDSALAGVTVNLGTGIGQSTVGTLADIGVDTFTGVNGVEGSRFADVLIGSNNALAESFRGEQGADNINGGGGVRDRVDYRNAPIAVVVNLATNTATDGFGTIDTLANIEDASGSEFNDTITGSSVVNYLVGQAGNDFLVGGGADDLLIGDDEIDPYGGVFGVTTAFDNGADVLDGGAGNDTMRGGLGNDTYFVDSVGDVILEAVTGGIDFVRSGAISINLASYANVENVILTGALALSGTGNAAANSLDGTLAAGANVLTGLAGDDLYIVGVGDSVVEAANGGTDTVRSSVLSLNLASFANVENAALTGALALSATGNTGNNNLSGEGNTAANVLTGLAGNDVYVIGVGDSVVEAAAAGTDGVQSATLSLDLASFANVENATLTGALALSATGNAANNIIDGSLNTAANVLTGLAGSDFYVVGTGDSIVEAVGGGTDTVSASRFSVNLANYANVENIALSGSSALTAIGNSGANVITGNVASNTLIGNAGSDTFVFNTALSATNIDTISDFSVADDTINLRQTIMSAIGAPGVLDPNAFVIGAAAQDASDRIVYNSATGDLIYDNNGNVAGGEQQFARLTAGLALTNSDFFVF